MPKHGGGKRTVQYNPKREIGGSPWLTTDTYTRKFTYPDKPPRTELFYTEGDYAKRTPIMDENPPHPRNKKKRTPQGYDNLP